MFNLLFNLILNDGYSKSKVKKYFNFFCSYILPTIIIIIFSDRMMINAKYDVKGTLINIIIFNLLYSSLIHVYIQKKVFPNLQKDVIIKFVPDRVNSYIILRVFMIFMKIYLPIITSSIIIFKDVIANLNCILYICCLLITALIICINVSIAIYYKYYSNIVSEMFLNVGNFFIFILISSLFIFEAIYTPIWYIENLVKNMKNNSININKIEINHYEIFIIILVLALLIVMFKFIKNFLYLKGRVLIFQRTYGKINSNKITNRIEAFYDKVYSINFSNIEKIIFSNDVKVLIRENKYSLIFTISLQLINIGFILFLYFSDNIKTIEASILSCKLLTGIEILQILISCFCVKTTFEKNVNLSNDFRVLKNYNIKFTKKSIIKVKTQLLSAIVFPKITSIFSILILSSLIINSNVYLSLIYLLSMIQLLFIKKTMELWYVKSINKLNNNNAIIKIVNVLALFGAVINLIYVYWCTEKVSYIKGQVLFIAITVIIYLYNLRINNSRDN